MTRWFHKELAESPVYVNGHPMRFEFLETSDPALIAEMENCIRRNAGGIVEISHEKFTDEIKKKEKENPSGNSLRQPHQRQELTAFQLGNPAAAVASRFARQQQETQPSPQPQHPMPDPIDVPTADSFALPPLARMKDLKAMANMAKPK